MNGIKQQIFVMEMSCGFFRKEIYFQILPMYMNFVVRRVNPMNINFILNLKVEIYICTGLLFRFEVVIHIKSSGE